jgi:hypothetical protein
MNRTTGIDSISLAMASDELDNLADLIYNRNRSSDSSTEERILLFLRDELRLVLRELNEWLPPDLTLEA